MVQTTVIRPVSDGNILDSNELCSKNNRKGSIQLPFPVIGLNENMSFFISNKPFADAKKFYGCYYKVDNSIELIRDDGIIGFLVTNEFGQCKKKLISNFKSIIRRKVLNEKISSESFYLTVFYSSSVKKLYIQTDMVGFISAYVYLFGDNLIVSNDVLQLITIVKQLKLPVSLKEKEVRKFVFSGNMFTEKTIFDNINIIPPAVIRSYSFNDLKATTVEYHDFKFCQIINDVAVAAKGLYNAIDKVFEKHKVTNFYYGLGVSGGLDSRVAGYFAVKHNYKIKPYFLGREKNQFGIRTNDASRSLEVANALGFTDVAFINNTRYPYRKRVMGDVVHAPLGSPNVAQNIGYDWRNFDVLLHGMMGGELFGGISFLASDLDAKEAHQLAKIYIDSMCQLPKSIARYSLMGKALNRLPGVKSLYRFKDKNLIIDDMAYEELFSEITERIQKDKHNGYSNTNILFKLFIYTQGKNVNTGYYSTIENTVPSLGVYFNPVCLEEMLKWDKALFHDRKVQKQLLLLCDEISKVRDQTIKSSICDGYNTDKIIMLNLIERAVRGSGMYYDTYPLSTFDDVLKELSQTQTVKLFPLKYKQLLLSKSSIVDFILKLAWLEKEYSISYR